MNTVYPRFIDSPSPPSAYTEFIEGAKCAVLSKNMRWQIDYDQDGIPVEESDWDLRVLTGSHAKHASRLGPFLIDERMRSSAIEAGWAPASLPDSNLLDENVQDFIKALVVHRCRAAMVPRDTRNHAHVYKAFFSVIGKAPWTITSEDIFRFEGLRAHGESAGKALRSMVRAINENLLSYACPLGSSLDKRRHFAKLQSSLDERSHGEKLPNRAVLYELVRIVFTEPPASHNDLIRFCAIRIMMLTGLRLNEVLLLPADCLRWEDHVDVVTGLPADQVGGVSRTLRLRYFASKQEEGLPDLLVEEHQWVPTRFQESIATAVELALAGTVSLRSVLAVQHAHADLPPKSDLRQFRTSAGVSLTTADLLFLQAVGRKGAPEPIPPNLPITTLNQNAIYLALGLNKLKKGSSFFTRYGSEPGCRDYSIKPHSLRHLMNTELFRLGVPDTVITQQFGRLSVAQSYQYDHRSLAEKLAFVSLPGATTAFLTPGSAQEMVAKMVVGGLVPASHISRSFSAIQAKDGDLAAFRYLVVNSDGFHVTPYGFCINSFTMNPCAKHLKCFDRCKHFAASGILEHRVTLESLRLKLREMHATAAAKPAKTVGRCNQIAHAKRLLAGVEATLEASPHTPVFPEGVDHSAPVMDVLS